MVDYTREILSQVTWDVSATQVVSYDTQFNLDNFFLSTITLKDPRLLTNKGNHPTVPACFVVHERKFIYDHDMAIKIMTDLIPELKKTTFISSSDDEFTSLLERNFNKSFVAKDENHMVKKIERAGRNRKGTTEEVSFYKRSTGPCCGRTPGRSTTSSMPRGRRDGRSQCRFTSTLTSIHISTNVVCGQQGKLGMKE